ncbi:MAG: hypothetical protein ACJASG_000639 [Oleiphilaceae bacterium]|jgi:hypothetical protein
MFEDSLPTFEALLALAKEDPVEFEALRDQLCKQIVDQAPEHISRRLKGLQFKINMERRRSKTALKSCLELSKLMNNSLIELDEALSNPQEFLMKHNSTAPQAENTNQTNTKKSSAEIIQLFPKPSVISETPTIVTPTTSED